jgi:hypothetical protein
MMKLIPFAENDIIMSDMREKNPADGSAQE